MNYEIQGDRILLFLKGRIDSNNAPEVEKEIFAILSQHPERIPAFDLSELAYISSVGLRILMRVKKKYSGEIMLYEVPSEIYDILDTTGFIELFQVKKKLRSLSVENMEMIGQGAVGTVYRIDADTVVKVYDAPDAIPIIENEKKMAKLAFLKGLPTAISFDIVRVGDRYGSVFELLNAKTLNDLLVEEPERTDEILDQYVELMKQVHETTIDTEDLPTCKEEYLRYMDMIDSLIPKELSEKLRKLILELPEDRHLIHGDLHMKNVMLSGDEMMLIDMDSLATGQPIFDIQGLYVTYIEFEEDEPGNIQKFLGISAEKGKYIWNYFLRAYYRDYEEEALSALTDRIRILAGIRFLHLLVLLDRLDGELGKKRVRHTTEHLMELCGRVEHLV